MELEAMMTRARRGLREERRLYVVAVSSLAVAFLSVGGALLAMQNLSRLAERWGESARMTVYLAEGIESSDRTQLQITLESLPEVASLRHLSGAEAREEFLAQADVDSALAALPADAFPASFEVELAAGTNPARAAVIAERLGALRGIDDIETYQGWHERLAALVRAGRGVAGVLTLLVLLCVVAVIGNTIRLAVARRRDEIEVMKLCGATDRFVRGPFVLEGAFQGLLAALLSVLVLRAAFAALRGAFDASLAALAGTKTVFLHPALLVAIIASGGLLGAAGSAVSLRRYLQV
ncbi:MAG: permease-like cell division protein FtsX [Myxococcota bacterium]